ncbi:hypothetical protein [Pseudomonas sp. B21-048]|uniref:hypothetical protein n=1 Tax=Pseudomonas sp. B21-048 TaxID=2895490 RepID=UPI0021608541|nr:hypothetical protein [Pseudomonas sp. B21-048]UVL00666.1 hypothetical protein LOY56_10015 [Pseudomonas sp. B21-048]
MAYQVIKVLISGLDGGRVSQRFSVNLELLKWPIVDADWIIIVPDFITMGCLVDWSLTATIHSFPTKKAFPMAGLSLLQ